MCCRVEAIEPHFKRMTLAYLSIPKGVLLVRLVISSHISLLKHFQDRIGGQGILVVIIRVIVACVVIGRWKGSHCCVSYSL